MAEEELEEKNEDNGTEATSKSGAALSSADLAKTAASEQVKDAAEKQSINEISGGEFQRCLFAKALMKQCSLFIFDEPTSAMDIKYQKDFFELLKLAKKNLNAGIIISIHDINLSIKYCDRLIVLNSGKIIYNGDAKKITKEILSEAFDTEFFDKCTEEVYYYY